MPACRQMSLTGKPASACLRIETIWVSVKRDFFMEPPGWGKHARKFYLWGVCGSGKLTEEPGGLVSYTVTIANDAVEADPVAYSGMTVRRLTDLLSAGSSLGGLCAPELPHLLRPGESLVCKVDRNINEWPGFLNTFTV